jgi:hypothetical protein
MKKSFVCLLLILCVILLTACGNSLKDYAGTYKLEYSKYVGDAADVKDTSSYETLILNDDGTGKSNRDGLNIDVKWSMEEDNISLTETYAGIKIDYNGTIKDGKLTMYNGDKTNDLTYEKVYNKE